MKVKELEAALKSRSLEIWEEERPSEQAPCLLGEQAPFFTKEVYVRQVVGVLRSLESLNKVLIIISDVFIRININTKIKSDELEIER